MAQHWALRFHASAAALHVWSQRELSARQSDAAAMGDGLQQRWSQSHKVLKAHNREVNFRLTTLET